MIIGISGKINSGKDTVGKIIQIITNSPHFTDQAVADFLSKPVLQSNWKIKKFADKIKDIVCLLIGCTREQLEDREFKEKELGEEWWYYTNTLFYNEDKELVPYLEANNFIRNSADWYIIKLTPRLLMQLLGTEAGRQIIHPNIWVNALMSEYKDKRWISKAQWDVAQGLPYKKDNDKPIYPNWIITDMRFPNELKAVKDKDGITIRVNREIKHQVEALGGRTNVPEGYFPTNQHESETALDNEEFTYVIENNNTIKELIQKVREILIKEKLI